jgi:hypothetical protein
MLIALLFLVQHVVFVFCGVCLYMTVFIHFCWLQTSIDCFDYGCSVGILVGSVSIRLA